MKSLCSTFIGICFPHSIEFQENDDAYMLLYENRLGLVICCYYSFCNFDPANNTIIFQSIFCKSYYLHVNSYGCLL